MNQSLEGFLIIGTPVVLLGLGLIYLARLARRKTEKLKRQGITEWNDDTLVRASNSMQGWATLYFGPLPKGMDYLGRTLVFLVIGFVAVVVLGAIALVVLLQLHAG